MTVRRAVKEAWKLYTDHPGEMLLFMLLELAVRLSALCPLLFLADQSLRFLSILCVPLWLLIVLPARQRAAEVMQMTIRHGGIFSKRLLIGPDWGKHVLQGIKMTFLLLLWALPIAAAAGVSYYFFTSSYDFTFVLLWIRNNLGSGDLMQGFFVLLVLYLCLLLPLFFGIAFHSGRRHERALSDKRFLKGKRWGVIRAWLAGLIAFVPFVAATVFFVVQYVFNVFSAVSSYMNDFHASLNIPAPGSRIVLIGIAFVVLLLPLVPFRTLVTACYVHGCWEGRE